MSSIDIGKIKFTWRGNYDVATTYEAEDIVYSSGSTWICVATSPVTGSAPSPSNPDWNKISQGSDLGSLSGLTTGSIVYFDGNDFQQAAPSASHESVVIRDGVPVYKPQGIIQLRRFETNRLMRINAGNVISALSWYPIDQILAADGSVWENTGFEVEITPKFANSILEVNLSLQVGWREGSYHSFGRITYWDGSNWVRHPSKTKTAWHNQYAMTNADHGAYTYTTNGATYVYQGEQVQLKQYYDVDGVHFTAGTPTKFRWEYTSTSGSHYIWLNASIDRYNNNYSRSSASHISVTEINNGD